MARDIAGSGNTGNFIDWTGRTAIDSGDWSIVAWSYVRSVTNTGHLVVATTGSQEVQKLQLDPGGTAAPFVRQRFATTNATVTSLTALTLNRWSLVVGMFDSGGAMGTAGQPHIFQGDVATAMFQPSETQVASSGARSTGGTTYRVGNQGTTPAVNALDGIMGPVLIFTRLLTLAEAEGIRLGIIPVDATFVVPLNDRSTVGQNPDLISGAIGAVTGAAVAVAEDPPVLFTPVQVVKVGRSTAVPVLPSVCTRQAVQRASSW